MNDPESLPRGLAVSLALALDAPQESWIVADGLHRQDEGGELRRTPIHVRPVQVPLQNQAGDPPGRVPGLDVHVSQDVEGISERVPGAAGRVADRIKVDTGACGARMTQMGRNPLATRQNALWC